MHGIMLKRNLKKSLKAGINLRNAWQNQLDRDQINPELQNAETVSAITC